MNLATILFLLQAITFGMMQIVSKRYRLTIKDQAGNVQLISEVEMNLKEVTNETLRWFVKFLNKSGLSLTRENLKQVYYSELPLERPTSTLEVALDLDGQKDSNPTDNPATSVTENLLDFDAEVCKDFQLSKDFVDALLSKKKMWEKVLIISSTLSMIFCFIFIATGIEMNSSILIILGVVFFLLGVNALRLKFAL